MAYVKISKGKCRRLDIKNAIFPVIKNFITGTKGSFLTVDGSTVLGSGFNPTRIYTDPDHVNFEVDAEDYNVYINAMKKSRKNKIIATTIAKGVSESDTEGKSLSDEEIMERIQQRFDILHEMTGALCTGDIRAMIVTGPPGVGKSYGVNEELERGDVLNCLSDNTTNRWEFVKGALTALGLYCKLFEYCNRGDVLVFDDCDTVFTDELSLNILKAALDTNKKRFIHWNADSHRLRAEKVPAKFEFNGAVGFITNIKLESVTARRLRPHLDALISRCHYIDLTLDTMHDKYLWIRKLAESGALFQGYNMTQEEEAEILAYMLENKDDLREMSLRMAIKMADLWRMKRDGWKILAASTCMKRRV